MDRERQEYLEGRGRMLREMSSKYEQTQEVILRRIRSSIQDHDHPSTHNELHHQSTRRLHRPNDNICVEHQMKRGGLRHNLLKPLRKTKACSSMKSLSVSDVDPPDMKPFPPSDEPRKRQRPYHRIRGSKMAVEQDCCPYRPEDPSPELCEDVKDIQDHLHDKAELAAWIARSMGRIVHSTEVNSTPMEVHSPVDSCTPEKLRALPFLHTPVPPPAADKPSRLSRLKSLLMGAKDGNKANYTPAEEKKIEGLKLVSALAEHHAEVLLPELHDICLTVIQEVKNLLSMVSRAAMITLANLYAHLQRKMDQEVESTACVLLHKAGESSQFIREDVEAALSMMVQNCSPGRILHALLTGGLR
ncbi:hypothetical protein AOLI_G00288970 [Acnodon oligacanthus]